jgi:uncharacterized RmlC-like cupin family protein
VGADEVKSFSPSLHYYYRLVVNCGESHVSGWEIDMSDNLDTIEYPSGCRVASGGLVADNAKSAGGGSGGMRRGSAVSDKGIWMGTSVLPPGHASVRHHHDGQATIVYILSGSMAFLVDGPNGDEVFEAGEGEFAVIPGGIVHREENRGTSDCVCIVARNATIPQVVNLDS